LVTVFTFILYRNKKISVKLRVNSLAGKSTNKSSTLIFRQL